ncbi:MAG: DUF2007 domain-containing protein [Flavobacteriaceae bacterium]|nr:DUF2007 domain-containing protein [Flavobacteriaceae bacterium]
MKLITIKMAGNESELFVLRSKLESEGIKCFMKNEFTTQVMNYLPTGVELQVVDSELKRANEIINQIEAS